MPAEPPARQDSGSYSVLRLSPEARGLQEAVSRMFATRDVGEIIRLATEAASAHTRARRSAIFLFGPDGRPAGGDPALLPEPTVVDYARDEGKPLTVPHLDGWITVLGMRLPREPVGILVLDVTGRAEDVARMNLEPLTILADQAALMIRNAQLVSRTVDESNLLSNILDSITNAIVTLDAEGLITRINRNAMAMLEVESDAVGRPYREAFPAEVTRAVDELLQESERQGYTMEKMVTVRLQQGLEIHVAVSISILRDESFAPRGTITVLRDMTASRELERFRKLDQLKSEFVANVSHELKTPLTSIKAYTEALLDMAREEQTKSFLKVIDEESDRLLALINDLLNVSRIQSGRIKMNLSPASPRSVVDEIMGISKVQSERHQIVLDAEPDLPELLLDKEKMKEVMVNLISNAIKYSPKGGEVRVRLRREEANLRIDVRDQGVGIPREHQPKIFEAFYRVDTSYTAEIPGTGLGLVIVKAIVEHHGGSVSFESDVGKGTTFTVLLPIRGEIPREERAKDMGSMAQ